MKLRIFSTFAGYGTDHFALKQLGIPYENVGFSEINKYATQCFKQNHGGENYGDITQIDWKNVPDFDLLTGGFPCTDVSVAGKQDLSKGRTILGYELVKALIIKQPKYFLFENVKGLMSKKFNEFREELIKQWTDAGYNVYYKVLNTKDYGIPQSRSRVWFVGFRKDIDKGNFKWPEPEELKIFLKDILEQEVDKKYYLSEKLQDRFSKYLQEKNRIINLQPRNGQRIVAMRQRDSHGLNEEKEQQLEPRNDGCSNSLTSVQKDNLVYDRKGFDSRDKLKEYEICPTLATFMGTGGNNVPLIETVIKSEFLNNRVYGTNGVAPTLSVKESKDVKVLDLYNHKVKDDGVSSTITSTMYKQPPMVANCIKVGGLPTKPEHYYEKKHSNIVGESGLLRRLSPTECFRLQGFLNDEIDISNLSDTQCYKLAGNGQSLNVVTKIFKAMFGEEDGM